MSLFNWFKKKKKITPNFYTQREVQLIEGTKILLPILEKALERGDNKVANLNYAKLEESYRQLTEENYEKYIEVYSKCSATYESFRNQNSSDKPNAFMPHAERILKDSDSTSEMLKKATDLSKSDISEAINLIQKAIRIDVDEGVENYQAHIKLANYLFKNNQQEEAIRYLKEYSNFCEKFHTSEVNRQISYLYKRQKNYKLAIKYDCYSIYYHTMFQGPYVFEGLDEFIDSFHLSRNFKNPKLEEKVNNKLIDFWGVEWLKEYYKKYLKIDAKLINETTFDKTVENLKPEIEEKSLEKFDEFINKLIESS